MTRLFLLAILFGCLFSAQAGTTLDSLQHRLANAAADTNRVHLLYQLAAELRTANVAQSLRYGQAGLRLARQLHYPAGEVLLLHEIGTTYFYAEDLANAARYYQQAVRKAQTLPQAGRQLALALRGLGQVAVMQHDYAESQRYFHQAMRQIRHSTYPAQPQDLARIYNSLGVMYFDWLNSGQAYPDSVKRLCLYYNQLTLTTIKQRTKPSPASLAVALNGVGNAQRMFKRYDSTDYYHRAALRLFQPLGSPYDIAQTKVWLGDALVAQHRAAEALPMLRAALSSAGQLHLPALQADCSLQLADALAAAGQAAEAYRLAKTGQRLLDSLEQADQNANLTRMRVQFDTEQERTHVRELTHQTEWQAIQARKQRQYFWGLASFLLAVVGGLVVAGTLARRLQRQRAQLLVARAEQDRLYALIAHDLRSPVMTFSGLADLLTTYVERQDTARLLGLGGRVRQAADSLRELLDNLLSWALMQRGELQPLCEPLLVAPLLAEIDRLYRVAADTAGISLEVVATYPGHVLADRQMTLTVLRNLVSNALHATSMGGRITVRAMATGTRQLLLKVIDTGQGMSLEELTRIMSGDELLTAPRYRGRAGLGLRLSRLFAQAQGGQLVLHSALGQGTTATLSLPCPDPLPVATVT